MCSAKGIVGDDCVTYMSSALQAWWIPRTNPLAIRAFFKTSWSAVLMSIGPPTATGAAGTSL